MGFAISASLAVPILLALIVWVAHFSGFLGFGLYHDDYFFIARFLDRDWSYVPELFKPWLQIPQGRPFCFFLAPTLAFLGDHLGGLPTLYLVGFLIVTGNAYLFYRLLRRDYPLPTALAGSLCFCLFPADTTQFLLNHTFCLQVSLMCLLIASHLYLSGRRSLAYLVVLGSLLSYETPFPVFLGIPLLQTPWDRRWRQQLLRHGLILVGMILVVVILRKLSGEGGDTRVANTLATFFSDRIPLKILGSLILGPLITLFLFVYGPLKYLVSWTLGSWIAATLTFLLFLIGFQRLSRASLPDPREYPIQLRSRFLSLVGTLQIAPADVRSLRLLGIGVILLILAYLLGFTHFPQIALRGMRTSTHLAATVGGSMMFAAIASLGLSLASRYRQQWIGAGLLSLYLATVVGYRTVIQADFQRSWQYQQSFWGQVIQTCPDLAEGTVILVERENLPETKFIGTHSTFDPQILEQIYRFPTEWRGLPILLTANRYWSREELTLVGGEVVWRSPEWAWLFPTGLPLPQGNVIWLRSVEDQLVRVAEPIQVQGQVLTLKPLQQLSPPWPPGALFRYFGGQSG